jgi:Protein of unknown function (DUF2490)
MRWFEGDDGEAELSPVRRSGAARKASRVPPRGVAGGCVLALAIGLLAVAAAPARAQRTSYSNWNAWFTLNGEVALTDRWSFLFDVSDRRSGPVNEIQALFARIGASYELSPHVHLAVGGNRSESFPFGKEPSAYKTPEWRLWEHVLVTQELGRLSLSHRYRLEQRFQGKSSDGSGHIDEWVHTGRFRYQVRGTLPVHGNSTPPGGTYLTAADEVFISFGPAVQSNIFDQNRATVAVGWRMTPMWRLEVGYLNQLTLKSSGHEVERNHTLVVSAGFNRPLRR